MACTAFVGLGAVTAPQASAAPGGCGPPHRNYQVQTSTGTVGTVGVNLNACPDQAPSSWSISKGEEAVGIWGGANQKRMMGDPRTDRIGPNDREFSTRVILMNCVPAVHWVAGPNACWTEAEWSVHLRVFKEGNEVKWTENVQQTQKAGPLAPNYWVTTGA
ncbi:hypothetical protein SLV14_000124 [Streptomyces sp. Je 1-4]|uniref:hypothetical protein n=1 Tax=Streptomyces TaxID=1883 RepID=UPI0021DACAE7|nr:MULTISPECIES: hypothetical protein [unclassified Streptomyces]UYB37839.1 hypothetical protein SLV14_000124 [Streptomyces sp. Je 1-4]UZQ33759.1 hypothetical protein SLV14N_000124 [Streptomyces sp. Je 1-4] [Streptomyces sp. Je 1-4 4N24]UZQ41177.1 hypothetical protein SLV14NA_000124 [Streptomyces sp. Je 1-4] [Streptomyces sp. Je 1-4 4N24_ara]